MMTEGNRELVQYARYARLMISVTEEKGSDEEARTPGMLYTGDQGIP
jgi:hypothetical protein